MQSERELSLSHNPKRVLDIAVLAAALQSLGAGRRGLRYLKPKGR